MAFQGSNEAETQLLNDVSRERLWRDTQVLGSSYRASGSEEERAAVKYIVDQLTEAGIESKVYELDAFISYHKSARCQVLAPEEFEIPCVARAYTESVPNGIELEVVVAGEYDGDLSDKAVLTARDWPGHDRLQGARLQIHAQTTMEPNLHRGGGTGVWGTPTVQNAGLLKPQTPGISISRPDGDRLRELIRGGRGPVRVRVQTEVETGWKRISFPVATIPGREKTFVLTGGHLDSHDPGATDNATGDACLLELTRLFHARRDQLTHGLKVGWWTGHESAGYAGSTWFADNEWQDLRDNCLLYWNNDGPGIRDATNIEARYSFPQTQEWVLGLIREYWGRDPEIVARPLKMGDQSFWSIGLPSASVYHCLPPDHPDWAVVFGAGHGRWWHSTGDTLEYVDPDILVDDTRFYALALYRLCTAPVLPFNFVTQAQWMKATLEELQEAAGGRFDLTGLIGQVDQFESMARELQAAAKQASANGGGSSERILRCQMRLSTLLNPAFFTLVGPYDQDLRGTIPGPAVRYPLPTEPPFQPRYFPGLQRARQLARADQGDAATYAPLYTTLLRERNRAAHALTEAMNEIRAALA
jgi:hypothetical protein